MTNEQLAAAAQSGDRRALFDLWEAVKPFCLAAARNVRARFEPAKLAARGITHEDMAQESYIAFCEAVQGFDASTGYKFITYLNYPLKNAFARLLGLKGTGRGKRDPLDDCASLDVGIGEDGETPLSDMVEDVEAGQLVEAVEDRAYTAQLHAALEAAMLETCDREQRDVLRMRYYKAQTRAQCGEALGMTRERVRQLESRALQNLRRPEAARLLRDFREEYAYSVSTSFGAWKEKGSNPERVVELIERRPSNRRCGIM